MKTTRSLLGPLLVALSTTAWAQVAPTPSPAANEDRSAEVKKQIAAGLPKYSPPKPVEAKPTPPAAYPDVLELPKMTIRQKPRPRLTPDAIATTKGLAEMDRKNRTTELDRALNKFTIPLFGVSAAERAREELQRQKKEQLNQEIETLTKALEQASPAEADALRDAAAAR